MTWTRNKSLMVNNLPGTGSESSMEIEKLTTELMLSRIELAQCKRALEKAEENLRNYTRKFQDMFDSIAVGILILDTGGTILGANMAAARVLGLDALEIIGQNIIALVVPEYRETLHSCLHRVLDTEQVHSCEAEIYRQDGAAVALNLNCTLTGPSNMPTACYQVVITEIPQAVLSDRSRLDSGTSDISLLPAQIAGKCEKRLRSLLDYMLDGCAFFKINEGQEEKPENLEYLDVNRAYEKLTGLTRENILGKKLADVTSPLLDINDNLFKIYRTVVAEEKTAFQEFYLEPLKKWLKIIAYRPQSDCFIAIFEDFTERKKIEQALLESEEHFHTLMKLSPIPISFANEKGEIEFVNDQFTRTFGYTLEDIPTLKMWGSKAYPDKKLRDEAINAWLQAAEAANKNIKDFQPQETQVTCKDGTVRYVEVTGNYIGTKLMAVFRDITQRRRGEEELRQSVNKVRRTLWSFIRATIKMVEMRDPYTANHQQKVSQLASAIARELGFTEDKVEYISIAGMVHDIGKIYVPTDILSRTGLLNGFEWEIMKTHVQGSYDILKNIEFPWPIAQIALQHHERLDGSGYPYGLKGDDICQEARILAVADTVEAMSSHRPYRPAKPVSEAMKDIYQNQGTLFDPEVVKACVRLFNEKGFTFTNPE